MSEVAGIRYAILLFTIIILSIICSTFYLEHQNNMLKIECIKVGKSLIQNSCVRLKGDE